MRNFILTVTVLLGTSFIALSCGGPTRSGPDYEYVPSSGFVSEIDETTTRGQLKRITPVDMNISWRFATSPDGRSVVFSGSRAGTEEAYQLYKLDIGSTTPVKLTAGGDHDAWDPSYTADGKFIVYRTGNTFWKMRADGSGARVRVPSSGLGNDYYPHVSKQDRVAFVSFDVLTGQFVIWTVGLDGSNLTQYREGNHPTWSPDGSQLVFEYQGDIWMIRADGTELTQLTATERIEEGLPTFSPDGNKVIYVSNEGDDGQLADTDIWYMNIDGSGKTQVTDLKSWDSWPIWCSSGIYFLSGRANTDKKTVRIWQINPD